MNLLDKPFIANGNYLCTWETQYAVAQHFGINGINMQVKQRNAMTAEMLFRNDSLYHLVPEKYRAGIYFLLDDGWDVPFDTDISDSKHIFGSLVLDDEKFPYFGNTPTEKLRTISEKIKELGYAGLGIWVCAQMSNEKEEATLEDARKYWTERAIWSREAGITYWKVDWGKHCFVREYCEMMTECVKENAPDLYIEHANGQPPYMGITSPDEQMAKHMAEIFEVSDVFRTYDVVEPFVDNVTLCRVDGLFSNADKTKMKDGVKGLINIESSPLIAVGLGLNMGIMYGGNDVNAALSWQRVAPPMSIFDVDYVKSERRLRDYRYGDARSNEWAGFYEHSYEITAPAVTARGTKLPLVESLEEPPFVMASYNNKTNAYCVCTLHRVIDPNNRLFVPADITIYSNSITAPIGIFGYYKTLIAQFDETIPENAKIYAQYMLSDEAFEVTDKVKIEGNKLIMSGELLRLWGREKNAIGFDSTPAVAIQIVI